MSQSLSLGQAARILYQEALALDEQRWDDWLAMYTEDAVFWVPGWTDEHRLTLDPERELSLIYCPGRIGLADRVSRIRSGLSVASKVLPRTAHALANVMWAGGESAARPDSGETLCRLSSVFNVSLFDLKEQTSHIYFGRYEHSLRLAGGHWQIAAKKVILMNDLIPTMLDFYCV